MSTETTNVDKFINFIYTFPICHRRQDRTFNFYGYYFPVCARCTGIYIGIILFLIYSPFFTINYSSYILVFTFLMVLPLIIDGLTQYLGFRESTNTLRFATGFAAGLGVVFLLKILII